MLVEAVITWYDIFCAAAIAIADKLNTIQNMSCAYNV
jgi:hypothetical protein